MRAIANSKKQHYYKKKGESEENKKIMEIIEEQYSKDPTHGYRRMTEVYTAPLKNWRVK